MTKADIEKLIQRRYRISQRASYEIAAKRDARDLRMLDYHQGCMSVLLCLRDDVRAFRRKKSTPRAPEARPQP